MTANKENGTLQTVETRGRKRKVSDERFLSAIKLAENVPDLARSLGVSRMLVYQMAERLGVRIQTRTVTTFTVPAKGKGPNSH